MTSRSRRRRLLVGAYLGAALLAASPALATTYVQDPLTDASNPAKGIRGGTFSGSGWTTNAADDTLWWEISDALETGSISFDVSGVAIGSSLVVGDNDIMTFYQAPTGVGEPVAYTPYFRNNDMRTFWRIFGAAAGGIAGATKIEMTRCVVGPPYYDNTCPASCTALDEIAYANGGMTDPGWDGAHTYHLEVAWAPGTMSFSRDGAVLGTVSYPGTFAPQPLRIHLGSPRNGAVGDAEMPRGITFSNLLVTGTAGTMTPVCDATMLPDGGTDGGVDPCTDGSVGAIADALAASWEPGVFPDPTDLNVEGDGTSPTAVAYLRFAPPGAPVVKATLRMHTRTEASSSGDSGEICAIASGNWDEATLTWANRPTVGAKCTASGHPVGADTEMEWDVTSLVNGGATELAVVSTGSDGVHYFSREAGGCALGPHILWELGATSSSSTAHGGGPGPGAGPGAGGNGSASHGAGGSGGGDSGSDAGCGCRVGGEAGAWGLLASLSGIAAVALRLRLRRRSPRGPRRP